jgi:hypothetical protein
METIYEKLNDDNINVKGWGVDADPNNEPTYPIKKYTGDDHRRLQYVRPTLQIPTVEILHSNERPGLPAVFGTTLPPKGLSGMIRRFAFRFSEGSWAHWLPLILADRVNVVEGVVDDLSRGHIPNIFAERGWKAEWKYNRPAAIKKIAVGVAVTSALIFYYAMRNTSKRRVTA